MEGLPVEIVGVILSYVSSARDVVLASATCRKWRRAFRDHLRVLSFRSGDWRGFGDLPESEVEVLMSRTILQTTNLRSLIIGGDREGYFVELSVSAVMSWLLHTKNSLQEFRCDAFVEPDLNIVEICVCEKLEKLAVDAGVIEGVKTDQHRFPSLRSLSLGSFVEITEHNLSALLSVCPKLESLDLDKALISDGDGPFRNLKLVAPPDMTRFSAYMPKRNALIFESDSIEHLNLDDAYLASFKFVGKGTLKSMRFKHAVFRGLEICDSGQSLESVQIEHVEIPQPELLYQFILKSSKLRKLVLWDVSYSEATDLETIAIQCPQLSTLAIGFGYYLRNDNTLFPYSLGGSTRFEHVLYLEVGWLCHPMEDFLDEFFDLIEGLLERCPSLRQLVIEGIISDLEDLKDCPRFCTPIYRILGKCIASNVQLGFREGKPLFWGIRAYP